VATNPAPVKASVGTKTSEMKVWARQHVASIEGFWNDLGSFSQAVGNKDLPSVRTGLAQLHTDVAALRALPAIPLAGAQRTWAGLLTGWANFTVDMSAAVKAQSASEVSNAELAENRLMRSTLGFFSHYGLTTG
jgi:hypothetical protein